MSLKERLMARKSSLNPTTTIVRTLTGRTFEETDGGTKQSCKFKKSLDSFPGYVIDKNPDLQVGVIIADKLYLGSQDVAWNYELLTKTLKITHILNVASGIPNLFPSNFVYYNVEILDIPESVLPFDECFKLLDGVVSSKEDSRVLVHCNAGLSRAPSIVIAFLMKKFGYDFEESYEIVKSKRPGTRPNSGFLKQLKDL